MTSCTCVEPYSVCKNAAVIRCGCGKDYCGFCWTVHKARCKGAT